MWRRKPVPDGSFVRQSKLSVDLHQSAFRAQGGRDREVFWVRLGIDSISLLPDAVLRTALAIVELEKKLGRSPRRAA
jgi:hypothetical protein